MSDPLDPLPVVSDRLYALILTSPRLRKLLLPGGLVTSPYKILNYQGIVTLRDERGAIAIVERRQRVQFQHDGVGAILDHFWGAGVGLAEYDHSAGILKESFRDEGKRHLVIQLRRPMGKGEILDFNIVRTAAAAFTEDEEWEETTVDHPVERLSRTVIFPKDRPCKSARLVYQGNATPLHIFELPDGTMQLNVRIGQPRANARYVIRWSW